MTEEEAQRELKRVSLRERSKQLFLTAGTVLALLATAIGFLSDSLGVLEFLSGREVETPAPVATMTPMAESSPTPGGMRTLQDTLLAPPTGLPSPVAPTPVHSASMTPTATALPVMAVGEEWLLVVAQFSNFAVDANFNVAGRIHEALTEQVAAAQLPGTRVAVWPEVINDHTTAMNVLSGTRARMVIWGEYDSGRVRVRFALENGGADLEWQRLLGAPTELSTTINLDVPRETQALALTALGRLYRNADDLTRARASFAQALAQQPSDEDTVATLTFYLAILDMAASPPNLDRAITGYTEVIEMRPAWVNAHRNRGLAYLARYWIHASPADVDAAIDDFSWTVDAKGDYAEAYIDRAIAYYARNGSGDLEKALADLNDAIRYSPSSQRAYYNRGLVNIRLDQRERWEDDLERALRIAPDYWIADHALCWGYALDELPEQAMPHCDMAREQDASGSTLDGRGLALAELGRLEEAAADLESYLAWLRTQPEAWSSLNNQSIYEGILADLRAGENPITAEVLDSLR